MIKTATVVCVGAATLDTIFRMSELPTGPGKFLPLDALEVAHGMASSAAAAIARLGGRSILLARVGADAAGARIVDGLSAAGIDCRHVRRVETARSPICTVLVDRHGERTVIPWYDPNLGADTDWLPLDTIRSADVVLADVRWPEGAAAVLNFARTLGVPAILDADTAASSTIEALAALATHVVYSEQAALAVSGESEIVQAVRRLGQSSPNFVAATGGEKGCFWYAREQDEVRSLLPPKVEVVDTLAAGDVFHGAFALAIAEGAQIEAAVAFANAAAALKCRVFGGRLGAPTREAVEQILASAP